MRKSIGAMILLVAAGPAAAQDWNNLATSEAINQMHATMRQHMIVEPAERDGSGRPPTRRGSRVVDGTYPVDRAIRREVEKNLVATVARKDRLAGQELSATFARHDLIGMTDRALSPFGLRSGNVIDAVTIYRLAMWAAAHGVTTPAPGPSMAGARRQTASGFDLAGAGLDTPAHRQQFSETLLYQAILIDLASEQAHKNGDSAKIDAIRKAARQALIASGIDPDRTRLTADGFVPIS